MWISYTSMKIHTETLFNKSLRLLVGFNREECASTFKIYIQKETNISELDFLTWSDKMKLYVRDENSMKKLAFALWAIAYCNGSDYNMYGPVYEQIRQSQTWPSLKEAQLYSSYFTKFYTEKDVWNIIYKATKIRFETLDLNKYVYFLDEHLKTFEIDDPMIYAIHAEAHMLLEPWKLWDQITKQPTKNALQVKDILDAGLTKFPKDDWLSHLKVHYCEMGPKSQFAYEVLPNLENSSHGHLRHMPSHIYIQVGEYIKSRDLNKNAVEIDKKDRKMKISSLSVYAFYECHNYHFVVFASCMCGDYVSAFKYADKLNVFVKERILEHNSITLAMCEPFLMIEIMVLVRFGEWDKLIDITETYTNENEDTYYLFVHYGKSIAYAAKNMVDSAYNYNIKFRKLLDSFSTTKMLHNESVKKIGELAYVISSAEIEYRKNSKDHQWKIYLQEALRIEDKLAYDEPPPWMIPVRQTLGALLLEQKDTNGLKYIKEDLEKWPRNVWSSGALKNQGIQVSEDIFSAVTWKSIKTSCACATTDF